MSRLGELGGKLHRGDVSIDFIGKRSMWYAISGVILVVCIASLVTLGLNFGIEFKGGAVFQFKKDGVSVSEVREAADKSGVLKRETIVQENKTTNTWRVQTEELGPQESVKVKNTLIQEFQLEPGAVSQQFIGASWGQDISKKAAQGLIVFLIAIIIYLTFAFEWKMAAAAIIALVHDIFITVGLYSLAGFDFTPATMVGLLTILGYSLYDTVVVFDKVRENTRSVLTQSKMTYSDAANLAVNQTLVRSMNTSIVALLPVGGLLFIGAGFLGAGTLKDLALVLFVGMGAGAYSSICIASPVLADMKEREKPMQTLAKKVAARRASDERKRAMRKPGGGTETGTTEDEVDDIEDDDETPVAAGVQRRVVQRGPRQQPRKGSRRSSGGKKKH